MAAQPGYWYPLNPIDMEGPSHTRIDQNSVPKSTIPHPIPSVRFTNRHTIEVGLQNQFIEEVKVEMIDYIRLEMVMNFANNCPKFTDKIRYFVSGLLDLANDQLEQLEHFPPLLLEAYENHTGELIPVSALVNLLSTTLREIQTSSRNHLQHQHCRDLLRRKVTQIELKQRLIEKLMKNLSVVSMSCVLPPVIGNRDTRTAVSDAINGLYTALGLLGEMEVAYAAQTELLNVLADYYHLNV